jgi:hypothetical protein
MARYPSVRTRHAALMATIALSTCLTVVIAQCPVSSGAPAWQSDFERALEAAAKADKLLLVCFNADLDGEPGNATMVNEVYRSAKFLQAAKDVVLVVGSLDRHGPDDAPCPRFGQNPCSSHQTVEKKARRHLFGDQLDIIAPQHVLLFPDGSVAWHEFYQVSDAEIVREIRRAATTWKKNERSRATDHLTRFKGALNGSCRDSSDYLAARTALCFAPEELFVPMLRRIGDPALAERLLRDIAKQWPERAAPRLSRVDDSAGHGIARLASELGQELAKAAAAADEPPRPAGETRSVATSDRSLGRHGRAQSVPRVVFSDGVERSVTGTSDKVTVLLFFLPGNEFLPAQVERWNRFAARMDGEPVVILGLGASVVPEADLPKTRDARFAFPAANYLYEQVVAPYGITSFPTAVVLDPAGEVVFVGDAYNAYEAATKRACKDVRG